jgi:L-aminopeptidase/D-esterase-like protein
MRRPFFVGLSEARKMLNAITDVPGIKVGHYTDREAITGCTVILCSDGAVRGVDVRGAAPGTRETDALHPLGWGQEVHAVVLSGGSAYGLDTAGGVMRYLEEQGCGIDILGIVKVPIVPAAILFDLSTGNPKVRPGAQQGYAACLEASNSEVGEGSVGAGTGAAVAKIFGRQWAIKGGIGTASRRIDEGIVVGAIVAVNAFGDVVDPKTGDTIAGPRDPEGKGLLSTVQLLKGSRDVGSPHPGNTTIGVIATNACLNKVEINKIAQVAHDGLAHAIRPCHTMVDGDALFALSLSRDEEQRRDTVRLGILAAEAVAEAIVRAVMKAETLGGTLAVSDLTN